jgi:hypothetical protein
MSFAKPTIAHKREEERGKKEEERGKKKEGRRKKEEERGKIITGERQRRKD